MNCTEALNRDLLIIGNQYASADPAQRKKAKNSLIHLTSLERKCANEFIQMQLNPSIKPKYTSSIEALSNKLTHIIADESIVIEKDKNLSDFKKTLVGKWRAIKNLFGTRISSTKLCINVSTFSAAIEIKNTRALIETIKQEAFNRLFTSQESIDLDRVDEVELGYSKTAHYDLPIFEYQMEFQFFKWSKGLSLSKLEDAFTKTYPTLSDLEKEHYKTAFQTLYVFKEIERSLFPHPTTPRTLSNAFAEWNRIRPTTIDEETKEVALKLFHLCREYNRIIENL